jgi:hypothetical protein
VFVSKNDLEQIKTNAVRQKCLKVAVVGETRELRGIRVARLFLSHNVFLVSEAWTIISSFSNTLDLAQSA